MVEGLCGVGLPSGCQDQRALGKDVPQRPRAAVMSRPLADESARWEKSGGEGFLGCVLRGPQSVAGLFLATRAVSALWTECVSGYEQGLNPHPAGEASDHHTPRVDDFDVECPPDLRRGQACPTPPGRR